MTNTTALAERLARTAAGTWGEEAAIWLLTEHGHWIEELDRLGLIGEQPMAGGGTATLIRWRQFTEDLRPVGTGSEIQVLNIARAPAWPDAATTFRSLASLDETNRRLVLHAIAWAAGGQGWAKSLRLLGDKDGCVCPAEADWHQYGCPHF
ncbi:hypothetical protein ACIRVF_07945 [Kitasatospora sp. NPDC101157]|uniref:hypothetical protein n=1 Tax=Kitasatospora sp. NPDC101157 TaxID=3364098 RepID=UPI0037FAFDEC